MTTVTVLRSDTARASANIASYLDEARGNIREGAAPAIQPPTQEYMRQELTLPQQVQPQVPQRKRGRPPKPREEPVTPKKRRGHLTDEQRGRLITMFQKGKPIKDIIEAFGISRNYAYAVGKSGRSAAMPRGGARNVKMTDEASALVAQELMRNPQSTGKDLVKVLSSKGIDVKPSTVNKHLISGAMLKAGQPNFTFKRLVIHHEARDSDRIKDARVEYIKAYLHYKQHGAVFIFIDETPFQATDFRHYGRAPSGERAISRKRLTRMSVTAITAITSLGTIPYTMFVRGSVNRSVFETFLHELLKYIDTDNYQYTIVMDNVGFHKTKEVKDMLRGAKLSFLLTAPWSCELNPIEYIFSIWKSRARVPPDITNIETILNHLAATIQSIPCYEVLRCILHVESKLFPLASERKTLSLRSEVKSFRDGNPDITFGDSQDIEEACGDENEGDDDDDQDGVQGNESTAGEEENPSQLSGRDGESEERMADDDEQ